MMKTTSSTLFGSLAACLWIARFQAAIAFNPSAKGSFIKPLFSLQEDIPSTVPKREEQQYAPSIEGELDGELQVPAYRARGNRYNVAAAAAQRIPVEYRPMYYGGSLFQEQQQKGSVVTPTPPPSQEATPASVDDIMEQEETPPNGIAQEALMVGTTVVDEDRVEKDDIIMVEEEEGEEKPDVEEPMVKSEKVEEALEGAEAVKDDDQEKQDTVMMTQMEEDTLTAPTVESDTIAQPEEETVELVTALTAEVKEEVVDAVDEAAEHEQLETVEPGAAEVKEQVADTIDDKIEHEQLEEEPVTAEVKAEVEDAVDDITEQEEAVEPVTALTESEVKEEVEKIAMVNDVLPEMQQPVVPRYPPMTSGITEEDVTDEDANAVEHANARISRICPKMHPDLVGLLFWIHNGETTEATQAMKKLVSVLDQEKLGEETTLALYRACGQGDIVRTMMRHAKVEDLQQAGMQVLWKLSSQPRASEIKFEEIGPLQKSLIAVGATDCAFAAMESYPDNVSLATFSLCVINNMIDSYYSIEEPLDSNVVPETLAVMKRFPDDTPVQFLACDILLKAATMAKPGEAKLAKLEGVHAISALAQVMERFSGVNEQLHQKAESALQATLR